MNFEELRKYDTLSQAQNALIEAGFVEQFDTKEGQILGLSNKKTYQPNDLIILLDKRFEGMSNPSDNMVLYAIKANDGTKGTMVDNFGGSESSQDPDLVKAIPMKGNHSEA